MNERMRNERLRLGRKLRVIFITFGIVTTLLMWFSWQGLYVRVFAILFIVGFVSAGLFGLQHLMRELIREQRRATGCCIKCGYDLRETPDRCPECGTAVSPAATLRH